MKSKERERKQCSSTENQIEIVYRGQSENMRKTS